MVASCQFRHRDCTIELISDTVLAWRGWLICFYSFIPFIPRWLFQILIYLIYRLYLKRNQFIGFEFCVGFLLWLLVRNWFLDYFMCWLYLKSYSAYGYLACWLLTYLWLHICLLVLHNPHRVIVKLSGTFILAITICDKCFLWLEILAGLHAWRHKKIGPLHNFSTALAFNLNLRFQRHTESNSCIYFLLLRRTDILLWYLCSKLKFIVTLWA